MNAKSALALSYTQKENNHLIQDVFTNYSRQRWQISEPLASGAVEIIEDKKCNASRLAAVNLKQGGFSVRFFDASLPPVRAQWFIEPQEGGLCLIRSAAYPKLVLDVSGASMRPGTSVIPYAKHGGMNQLWRIVPTSRVLMPMYR